jgi:uncharacterized protein YlxW (UPF0749 family)
MWIKRRDFEKLTEAYNENDLLRKKVNKLNKEKKNLEDEKIALSTENNRMNIVIQTTNDMEAEYQERVKALNKALTSVRVENATIRQILRDITNKPVNELIEAHRKAVRMLQYDKVQPCEEEAAEEKVSE